MLNYLSPFQQYQRRRFYENVTMYFILLLSYTCPQKDKGTKVFNQIARPFFRISSKFGHCRQTLIKVYKSNFGENSSSGSQVYVRGQREGLT